MRVVLGAMVSYAQVTLMSVDYDAVQDWSEPSSKQQSGMQEDGQRTVRLQVDPAPVLILTSCSKFSDHLRKLA
jgi:hypothetical protein